MTRFFLDPKRLTVLLLCAPLFLGAGLEIYRLVEGRFVSADLSKSIPSGLREQLAEARAKANLEPLKPVLSLLVGIPDDPKVPAVKDTDVPKLLEASSQRADALRELKLLSRAYSDMQLAKTEQEIDDAAKPLAASETYRGAVAEFAKLALTELRIKEFDRQEKPDLLLWKDELEKYRKLHGQRANDEFCRYQEALIFRRQFVRDQTPDALHARVELDVKAPRPDVAFHKAVRQTAADLEEKAKELEPLTFGGDRLKALRASVGGWLAEWRRADRLLALRQRALAAPQPGALLADLATLAADPDSAAYRPLARRVAHEFCELYLPARLDPSPEVVLVDFNGTPHTVARERVVIHWKDPKKKVTPLSDEKDRKRYHEFDRDWMSAAHELTIGDDMTQFTAAMRPTPGGEARQRYNEIRGGRGWLWTRGALADLAKRASGVEAEWRDRIRALHDSLPAALEQQ